MKRYGLTTEAKWIMAFQVAIFRFASGGLVAWLFVLAYGVTSPAEIWKSLIGAAFFGALWLYGTIRDTVGVNQMFHGSQAITIGDDWIDLPGYGRVKTAEIDGIRRRNTLLHRKLTINLKRKVAPFSKGRFIVYPHKYGIQTGLDEQLESLVQPFAQIQV